MDQARLRHASLRGGLKLAASFFALDCYEHLLRDCLPPTFLVRPFDVVSIKFCIHYAFEIEKKVRYKPRNVAEHLRPWDTSIASRVLRHSHILYCTTTTVTQYLRRHASPLRVSVISS